MHEYFTYTYIYSFKKYCLVEDISLQFIVNVYLKFLLELINKYTFFTYKIKEKYLPKFGSIIFRTNLFILW